MSLKIIIITLVNLFLKFYFIQANNLYKQCNTISECSEHQLCINGKCQCEPNSIPWHGQRCLPRRAHGDICHEQIECSSFGDPHLQCQKSKEENFSRCSCSEKFNFDSDEKKCKVVLDDHFTVKKMYPKPNDGMVVIGGTAGFSGRLGVQ